MSDRRAIEKTTSMVQEGKTNYFQLPHQDLTPPRDVVVAQAPSGGKRAVKLTWQTAYAGDEPISHYEVSRDGEKIGRVAHHPQTGKVQFLFEDKKAGENAHKYEIATVDVVGRRASKGDLLAQA